MPTEPLTEPPARPLAESPTRPLTALPTEPPTGPPYRVVIGPTGLDTDGDFRPDTEIVADGPDLVLHTDLDGDGLADQVLRLGPATLAPVPEPAFRWWAPWTWFADG